VYIVPCGIPLLLAMNDIRRLSIVIDNGNNQIRIGSGHQARTRQNNQQILGSDFYMPEHTKPLFNSNKIMSVQNFYSYHSLMETYKILNA
jgi:hypothetical protein